jgi:hypothetical protein
MNSTKTWLIAILVIGALPALSIYAWQTTPVFTEQTAVKTAEDGDQVHFRGADV